jgi:hypothetical protein
MLNKSLSARLENRNRAILVQLKLTTNWQFKFFADTSENVAFRDAAFVTFVDRGLYSLKLQHVLLFFPLQITEACSHNLAGVLITSALDFSRDEVVKFGSQIDVASRHNQMALGQKFGFMQYKSLGNDCQ